MITPTAFSSEQGLDFSGDLTVGSDVLFRGASQTMGKPGIQATLNVSGQSGWYGYVWASNVDFVPGYDGDDGARFETDLAIGYAAQLSDRWSFDLALLRYLFPGTDNGVDYNYTEILGSLWLDDQYFLTVGQSNKALGANGDGTFIGTGASFELPEEFNLSIEYGFYALSDAYGEDYSYTGIALGREIGPVTATARYIDTFGGDEIIFYQESIGSRFVLELSGGFE